MPFLTKVKTNWKYILLVLVLAVIVGGILWWTKKQEVPLPEVPEIKKPEKIVEDKTANWKTYRNEKYGFEIKYPFLYQVSDELVKESFYDYEISRIVSFSYAGSTMFNIYADNNSSNLTKCLKSYDNKDLTQTKEINGNKFYIYWDKLRDFAAGGQRGLQSQYRIIHNNYCYILHYQFSWRVPMGGEETKAQEANIEKQIEELELMLSTFRFIEETRFKAELLLVQLYPIQPEIIKIKFNKDVDPLTLNSKTVKLFVVSISAGTAGEKNDLSDELNYNYDKNNRILSITSKGMIIGGCAACRYELQLTDQIKDLEGNSLSPTTFPL